MDLARVDRDVSAAVDDLRRHGADVDWDVRRHVAGQRTLRELEALSESPLRDALASYVAWLTVARVAQTAEQRVATARESSRGIVRLENDVQANVREIVSGMLHAKSAGEARAYFAALPEATSPIREPEKTLRETRKEAFHRLGIDDVALRFLGVREASVIASARTLLASTEDVAREVTRRPKDASRSVAPIDLDVRLARNAEDGWPSRLTWRAVASLLPGLALRGNVRGDAPDALGAASFARAAIAVGETFHRATARSAPFALREPPLSTDALVTGFVFASAFGERTFHARVLGLATGRASDQAREVRAAFLLDVRLLATRIALRAPGDFEGLSALGLGVPLAPELDGVWPALRDHDLARFQALLAFDERYRVLFEREGDDWFRNPRAFATLAALAHAPALVAELAPRSLPVDSIAAPASPETTREDAAARFAKRLEESVA